MNRLMRSLLPWLLCALSTCACARDLVVGLVAPMSGPAAVYGREASAAAQAWFDHVNANGGINGQRVRLVVRDDEFTAAKTVAHVRQLVEEEGALALICGVGTNNWIAVNRDGVLQRTGTAAVGLMTPATLLRQPEFRQLFFLRPTLQEEIRRIVQQLSSSGFGKIGVLYQDDAFGKDALEGLTRATAEFRIEPVVQAGYSRDAGDVERAMKQILASGPTSIVMLGTSGAVAKAVQAARQARFSGQLMASSVVDPRDVVNVAGAEAARGLGLVQVMPDARSATLPAAQEFRSIVKAGPGGSQLTSSLAMEGYLTAKLLTQALRKAGRTPTPQSTYRALTDAGRFDLGGFVVSFDADNRTGSRRADISIINWQGSLLY